MSGEPDPCEECDGKGFCRFEEADPSEHGDYTCPKCGGEGLMQNEEDAKRWAEWKRLNWPKVIRNPARGEWATL